MKTSIAASSCFLVAIAMLTAAPTPVVALSGVAMKALCGKLPAGSGDKVVAAARHRAAGDRAFADRTGLLKVKDRVLEDAKYCKGGSPIDPKRLKTPVGGCFAVCSTTWFELPRKFYRRSRPSSALSRRRGSLKSSTPTFRRNSRMMKPPK